MADNSGNWGQVAGAAVQTLGNYAVNVAANKRQWKYQKEAMGLQQEYNKQLWDWQNAYNTPQAQMERLQAAGLNPRLIYGPGAASGSNAGPIAPTDVPTRKATGAEIPDLAMRRLVVRQMDAQYAATVQNIELAHKKGALMEIQAGMDNLKLLNESIKSKNYGDLAQAELDTRKFVALRSQELFQNERTKGNVMDQMMDMRKIQMEGMTLDNAHRRWRNELNALGIGPNDDIKWRVLLKAANRMGIDIGELLAQGAQKLKYLFD